jgi:hypothetical protein
MTPRTTRKRTKLADHPVPRVSLNTPWSEVVRRSRYWNEVSRGGTGLVQAPQCWLDYWATLERARRYADDGHTFSAIADRIEVKHSTIRGWEEAGEIRIWKGVVPGEWFFLDTDLSRVCGVDRWVLGGFLAGKKISEIEMDTGIRDREIHAVLDRLADRFPHQRPPWRSRPSGYIDRIEYHPVHDTFKFRGSDSLQIPVLYQSLTWPPGPTFYTPPSMQQRLLTWLGLGMRLRRYSYDSILAACHYYGQHHAMTTRYTRRAVLRYWFTVLNHRRPTRFSAYLHYPSDLGRSPFSRTRQGYDIL